MTRSHHGGKLKMAFIHSCYCNSPVLNELLSYVALTVCLNMLGLKTGKSFEILKNAGKWVTIIFT